MSTTTKPAEPETAPGSMAGPAFRKGAEAVRLAHNASVQSQIAEQADHNEEVRRAVNAEAVPALLNSTTGKDEKVATQLTIDSPTTVTHNYSRPADQEPDETKRRKNLGTIAKLAIGSGLMATGAGTMVGASMVWDTITNREPAVENSADKPAPESPNEDLRYSLDLGG